MSTVSISFRISENKAKQLEQLAEATDRPKSWLLERALDDYLDVHTWQVEHMEAGLRELREGAGVPHEEVLDRLKSWGKARTRKSSK